MKIVISSFGSSGDFNPCLGLARTLQKKGVDVIFLSNPYYENVISEAGLRFCPVGEYFDVFKEIQSNPAYLHPRKGPLAVWEMLCRVLPENYTAMKQLIRDESPDMVACHTLEYGGMIAAIEQSVPYAVLTPTPMGWFGTDCPGHANFVELPIWIRRLQARAFRRLFNFGLKVSLNPACRKQGIPTPFHTIDQIFSKACLNLGLWSKLFRGHAPDDPPNAHICGFVRDQHICDWDNVPDNIARLFTGSKRPVAVGLGSTASLHGDQIYQQVSAACKQLDHPCLLIGKDLSKYADSAHQILAVDFAPYGWVFPRAGLVIHHGGVNSTAETLRAGVPAIIVPHAYDQFDNAIRTRKAGLSRPLKTTRLTVPVLKEAIREVLCDGEMHQRAKQFADELKSQPDGAETAANHVIQTIKNRQGVTG